MFLFSHWPKTMAAAIPFLGSPELLSFDRQRQVHDSMSKVDFFGLGAIGPKEPSGSVRLEDLRKRPSRRFPLESLLSTFVTEPEYRTSLRTILENASDRLGAPEPDASFADPRLMARYALNVTIQPTGEIQTAFVSMFPHRTNTGTSKRCNIVTRQRHANSNLHATILLALEHPEKSSAELVQHALPYAQRLELSANSEDDDLRSGTDDIVSAALLLARDGTNEQLDQNEDWARSVFERAFTTGGDNGASTFRGGIMFNPVAIATLGIIHLWRRGRSDECEALLQLTGREDASAAHGFGAGLALIRRARPEPSLLLCCVAPSSTRYFPTVTGAPRRTKRRKPLVCEPNASPQQFPRSSHGWAFWSRACLAGASSTHHQHSTWDTHWCRSGAGSTANGSTASNTAAFRTASSQTAAIWLRQLIQHADLGDVHCFWNSSKHMRVGPQTRTAKALPSRQGRPQPGRVEQRILSAYGPRIYPNARGSGDHACLGGHRIARRIFFRRC